MSNPNYESNADSIESTHGAASHVADGPGSTGTKYGAAQVAGQAAGQAADVRDEALAKAAEVKDVARERTGDVAAVAKDELAKLSGEGRAQVQDLWTQASVQIREQVDAGRHQLAEVLHSLADELGEMASKSTQSGPVTALAKQASYRGGELSHWLANAEPTDLVSDIRRFARRRPVVFFGGAVLAGVLVGRLGRGLMAASQDSPTTSSGAVGARAYEGDGTYGAAASTSGATMRPREEDPEFGSGGVGSSQSGHQAEPTSTQPLAGANTDGGLR